MVEKPYMHTLEAGHQEEDAPEGINYCNTGYITRTPVTVGEDRCVGCGTRILDRYFLLVANQPWHVPCLRCNDCNVQLDSELTCFSRDGNIFCKDDYYRRYSMRRCSRCHMGVAANELIMRARDLVFHLPCFTCAACLTPLATGDHYGIHDDLVYCRTDYELLFQGEQYRSLSPRPAGLSPGVGPGEGLHFYNGITGIHKGRPRKRKNIVPGVEACLTPLGMLTNEHGELIAHEYGSGPTPRQKRVRTSFKHHQLRTMKSYFALNHNPDAKDLKQLAQKTQLSKRVLQVWFQNARAKYRRSVMKSDTEKPEETEKKSETNTSEDSEQLLDLSYRRSPALSDISSAQSLADSIEVPESAIEQDRSSDGMSDLFTEDAVRVGSDN